MAYLYLDSQRSTGFQERLHSYFAFQIREDPSLVYGDGFRAALRAFQTKGLASVVDSVVKRGRFP